MGRPECRVGNRRDWNTDCCVAEQWQLEARRRPDSMDAHVCSCVCTCVCKCVRDADLQPWQRCGLSQNASPLEYLTTHSKLKKKRVRFFFQARLVYFQTWGKWETTRESPTRVPTASSSPGEGKPDWWAVGVRDRVMELAGTKENWVTHMALRPRTPPLLPDREGTPTPRGPRLFLSRQIIWRRI